MRMKALALCLMTGFAATAAAQDSTLTLRQALKQMPQVVLSSTDAMQIVFLDVQAWRGLLNTGDPLWERACSRMGADIQH